MARFDRQIATALRLIALNGQTCTWRKIVTVPNETEPWNGDSQTITDYSVSICFLPTNKQGLESIALKIGGEIPAGCVLGYMGAFSFIPNLNDIVIREGKTLSVFYIDHLAPNGQNILYTMLLKE